MAPIRTLKDVIRAMKRDLTDAEAARIHDAAQVLLGGKQNAIKLLCSKKRGWGAELEVSGSEQSVSVLKQQLASKVLAKAREFLQNEHDLREAAAAASSTHGGTSSSSGVSPPAAPATQPPVQHAEGALAETAQEQGIASEMNSGSDLPAYTSNEEAGVHELNRAGYLYHTFFTYHNNHVWTDMSDDDQIDMILGIDKRLAQQIGAYVFPGRDKKPETVDDVLSRYLCTFRQQEMYQALLDMVEALLVECPSCAELRGMAEVLGVPRGEKEAGAALYTRVVVVHHETFWAVIKDMLVEADSDALRGPYWWTADVRAMRQLVLHHSASSPGRPHPPPELMRRLELMSTPQPRCVLLKERYAVDPPEEKSAATHAKPQPIRKPNRKASDWWRASGIVEKVTIPVWVRFLERKAPSATEGAEGAAGAPGPVSSPRSTQGVRGTMSTEWMHYNLCCVLVREAENYIDLACWAKNCEQPPPPRIREVGDQ